ncbi:MAG: two-component regulator propeller domain-containing protein [Dysgonomonas sp.]|nr:two-component regulator propeller domain-containing protein [Dysgonomonas sp.]
MKRLNLIVLLLYILVYPIYSIDNLKFENINNKNGLSHNTVRYIMQDGKGFIWASTINGLNRYDGREFIVMLPEFHSPSLTENKIKKTIEDQDGRIWVHLTSGIVNCYNTHTESFVDYTGRNEAKTYLDIQITTNGDVWLWGTKEGACRIRYVDDEPIATFFDKNTIQTNIVNFVFEDSNHQIWLGTDKELYKVNKDNPEYYITGDDNLSFQGAKESGEFIYFFTQNNKIIVVDKNKKRYFSKINISPQKGKYTINQTAVLDNKNILITGKQGTYLLNTEHATISSAKELFENQELIGTRILTDNKKQIWVYNKSGNVWKYETDQNKFKQIELIPKSILSVIDLERYDIYSDSRGIDWITTYGNGLFALDSKTGELSHFTRNNSELKTNYLLSVFEDRSGDIWIGTEHTGICKISLTKYQNEVFLPDTDKKNVENKIIRTVFQDKSGNIWIGTKSGNMYIFDENLHIKNTISLSQGMPYCIVEDKDGSKWVGTKGNGLLVFSKENEKYKTYSHNLQDTTSLANNSIYSILIDSNENVWIGTFGGGLLLCEKNDDDFKFKRIHSVSENQKFIRSIIQDDSGLIWVGGNNGIIVFDPNKIEKLPHHIRHYHFDKSNPNSLNNNEVKIMFKDSQNRIWIGTSGGGLNLANKDSINGDIHFKHFSSEEGIINNVIQSIEEDNNKNLWISTENGISKFNLTSYTFENYNFSDIWESNLFCESSSFKRKDGELMFGSYNGLYIFNPLSFNEKNSAAPLLTLTRLRINGIPVISNSPDSPLKVSISETKRIKLKNGQNSFSIEFSSLNYQNSFSDRYTYILEGYDKTWSPITQYNVASYKNIPSGKYTFKVKGINSSGILDENETTLEITIVPPFWKSSQAIAIYIIVLLVSCFFAAKLILKMNKLHNAVEIEKRLTEYRLRFFTNISHEFRTPLTIIRGSIENINTMPSLPPSLKKQIKVLEKSSSRLMRLIDQLLEFRKLQKDSQELTLEYTDAVAFFQDIYNIFSDTAGKSHIHFTFTSNKESEIILLDKAKMDKVLFNLLSNAFKHTPENGNIKVELSFDENDLELKVSDSGIGIPQSKLDLLFQRFKQINYSESGIGIGLHLTSELVNIHKGKIVYNDSEWGGASFLVTIPVTKDTYSGENIISGNSLNIPENDKEENSHTEEELIVDKKYKDYKLLIIEDDNEIREFLMSQLENSFQVLTASNGLKGLEVATNEQPDLIVCDVMMPEMNGFEVTKKLKSDFETSHIPIILLTAHSSIEHQVEGIEAGADSYIMKPFSTKYLTTRIIKLIEQREKLQHKFSQEIGTSQVTITTTDKDKEFLEKVHTILYQNLDNTEFSIEEFAQSVNLGRTMFYKKVKGITGYSPNEYIRIIRLKKAAELLRTTDLNISEVAYKVGFNDPFYFSRCFKDQFEITPTQFRSGNE